MKDDFEALFDKISRNLFDIGQGSLKILNFYFLDKSKI